MQIFFQLSAEQWCTFYLTAQVCAKKIIKIVCWTKRKWIFTRISIVCTFMAAVKMQNLLACWFFAECVSPSCHKCVILMTAFTFRVIKRTMTTNTFSWANNVENNRTKYECNFAVNLETLFYLPSITCATIACC